MRLSGGGTMGAGIAAVFGSSGWNVFVVENADVVRETILSRIESSILQLKRQYVADAFHVYSTLEDISWERVHLVVECVTENLVLKQSIFSCLERLTPAHIPLTSNSSSYPISEIGKGLKTNGRMAGLHFFMPAHVVPLVEVICSQATQIDVSEYLYQMMRELGKRPVLVKKDISGFIANRLQAALMREANSLLERNIASPADVDAAVRYGFGFRYLVAGPLLQKDLSGLDILYSASSHIFPDLCNDGKPSTYLKNLVKSDHWGVKTGRGYYTWPDESFIKAEKDRYEKLLIRALAILEEEGF